MKPSESGTDPPPSDSPFPSTTHAVGPKHVRRSNLPSLFFLPSVPGYDELEPIGEGGMGVVYRARDVRLKRLVALKMIRSGSLTAEKLARFRTEAEALARLAHPHIVPVFAWVEMGESPLLVLEYVPGGTLDEVLKEGPLAYGEAAKLLSVLARAVQAAHAAGVVHRDLKPGNVLLAPPVEGNSGTVCGGFPKVSDFGLAQLVDAGRGVTASGMMLGTPSYMSPEQAAGHVKRLGPPCDVWALGVLLYKALTGRSPFSASNPEDLLRHIINHAPRRPSDVRRGVPAELEQLCLACLKKNATARPTAEELAAKLERFCRGRDDIARQPAARPRRRVLSRAALAALLAVSLGGLVGVVATKFPRGEKEAAAPEPKAHGPLSIASLRVSSAPDGEYYGETKVYANYRDKVRIRAELSAPGYAYLIAAGCDGRERLLWPPDENAAPTEAKSLSFPPSPEATYRLNQDARGGVQAFAVVASRKPLPPFVEYRKRRGGAAWRNMPPAKHAFGVQGDAARIVGVGAGDSLPPGPLITSLERLSKSLRVEGDAIRVLAFPVLAEAD